MNDVNSARSARDARVDGANGPSVAAHKVYKAEFLARAAQMDPESLLDVGCGAGALLEAVRAAGCRRCVGLDVDPDSVEALRRAGFEAQVAAAEALPYADRSFDVVTFEYAAHHLTSLDVALLEASRVARRAVLVLDPWYDATIPSQGVALAYDLWSKSIDRASGMVHNPCPSAFDLMRPLQAAGWFAFDATHRLVLGNLPLGMVERDGRRHLDRLQGDRSDAAAGLDAILARAAVDGISADGALMFVATRVC
ncbi:class I SAM-dependent methyltransferase [Sphingosinicella sp. CPCC 101087]|uniref:class I SAM-dependent methyltransferase n=1 Tax=Sphingosinicella sp. CPCC 101087 TaxID=2497754 RepID=UPI00101D2612|nr:class I SAM-dependent methyltransferase [Sphingosinicella sp. CPCC 101087]